MQIEAGVTRACEPCPQASAPFSASNRLRGRLVGLETQSAFLEVVSPDYLSMTDAMVG